MIYVIVILLLLAFEFLYIRVASKRENLFEPAWKETAGGERDGVQKEWVTIRGGGIVFWFASLILAIITPGNLTLWFFVGVTLVALVGFIDDYRGASTWLQLILHLVAMTIAFYVANAFQTITWWNILAAYIIFLGVLYAFKFMDDVNGMTGLYSLAVLIPLMYVNRFEEPFVHVDFLRYPFLAAVIFLMFNYRKRAASTAGAVGGMSIAFWIGFLLLLLIVKTGKIIWLSFLLVYGVDVILTLLHRTYIKKPIFGPEKLHFYQILGNELRMDHRVVSFLYFIVQLGCSALIIALYPSLGQLIFWILLLLLMGLYVLKFRLIKVVKQME